MTFFNTHWCATLFAIHGLRNSFLCPTVCDIALSRGSPPLGGTRRAAPLAKHARRVRRGLVVPTGSTRRGGTRQCRFDGTGLSPVYSHFSAAIGRGSSPRRPSSIPAHGRRGSHHHDPGVAPWRHRGSGTRCVRRHFSSIHPINDTRHSTMNLYDIEYHPKEQRCQNVFFVQ